jgi:hypothetical protein
VCLEPNPIIVKIAFGQKAALVSLPIFQDSTSSGWGSPILNGKKSGEN